MPLTNAFHIPSYIIGIILAAVVAVVVIGGQRRITAIAELLVPFMAIVYIVGSLIIIYMFADQLPSVIRTIFHDAFSLQSAAGGAAGTVMKYAIRYGVARGLFSNEAGMGSTPHAMLWLMLRILQSRVSLPWQVYLLTQYSSVPQQLSSSCLPVLIIIQH